MTLKKSKSTSSRELSAEELERKRELARERARRYRLAHPERTAASTKRWREKNKEKFAATQKAWRKRTHKRRLEVQKAYRKAHPEKRKKWTRTYYLRNKERIIADSKKWRESQPREKIREIDRKASRKHYRKNREREIARCKAYNAAHKEQCKRNRRRHYVSKQLLFMVDAEAYAAFRREARMRNAMSRMGKKRSVGYSPRPSVRIPDYAVLGQRILDFDSPWLKENLTPSQIGYVRELMDERRKNGRER